MEILDIITENDEVIGKATREECHSNPDLIHHTVHFTLFNRKTREILITQRSFKKSHDGGKFCFLGEHILSGETYEQAICRGVQEELGFTTSSTKKVGKKLFRYDKQTELVSFYVVFWNNEKLNWSRDEMESVSWVASSYIKKTLYDFSEMTTFWINNIDWDNL